MCILQNHRVSLVDAILRATQSLATRLFVANADPTGRMSVCREQKPATNSMSACPIASLNSDCERVTLSDGKICKARVAQSKSLATRARCLAGCSCDGGLGSEWGPASRSTARLCQWTLAP
jgi:hypothetical protein